MRRRKKYVIVGLLCLLIGIILNNLYRDIEFTFLMNGSMSEKFTKKITLINTLLDSSYIYDWNEQAMTDGAIKGYVNGLDEPYTSYFTADEFSQYTQSLEDSYVGIGIVISPTEENYIEVVSAIEGSSAYEAGIKPGDIIYKVEDKEYYGDTMDNAIAAIKSGKEGEKVKITLLRGKEELEMNIERRVVVMNSVTSKVLQDDIGYLRISSFNTEGDGSKENTYTEFCKNIDSLKKSNIKKLIIDLRDNPGGALEVVVDIADYILSEGLITYVEYKDGTKEEYKAKEGSLDIPVVVLVNGNSASASEVLTGALKDHGKATIVGTTTYGKGVVQSLVPFADGSGLSITVARYYTPSGVCIHGTGIDPDVEVKLGEEFDNYYASELSFEEDIQLQKAIEIIK